MAQLMPAPFFSLSFWVPSKSASDVSHRDLIHKYPVGCAKVRPPKLGQNPLDYAYIFLLGYYAYVYLSLLGEIITLLSIPFSYPHWSNTIWIHLIHTSSREKLVGWKRFPHYGLSWSSIIKISSRIRPNLTINHNSQHPHIFGTLNNN